MTNQKRMRINTKANLTNILSLENIQQIEEEVETDFQNKESKF